MNPPPPSPRPFFAGMLWMWVVMGVNGVALCVGGFALNERPTKTGQKVAENRPSEWADDQISDPAKGKIRHGVTDAPAKPPGAIRIATYNLENFYYAPADVAAGDDMSNGVQISNEIKPVEQRKALAEVIHKINPDILACEEVDSKATITSFRDEYLADMGYTYIASIDAGDPRGIEQSILSRFPLSDEHVWLNRDLGGVHPERLGNKANHDAGKPMILKRSPMEATVTIPPGAAGGGANDKPIELTLFVVHHKSGAMYGYLREAEARGVLGLVNEWQTRHQGAQVIVLGDFNARPWEKSVKTYLDAGFVDAFGDVVLAESGRAGGGGRVGREREDPKYITHASNRAIDHILLSPEAEKSFDVKTRFVLGTPQRPNDADWRTTPPPPGYASDHYPVVVDLAPKVN